MTLIPLASVFPLTFHLLCKCRKMCESALKFLLRCHCSGFAMPPYHNANFKKKKKNRSSRHRRGIFCDLQGDLPPRKGHRTTNSLLSVFCGALTKKWSSRHWTSRPHKKKNDAGIKHRLALVKNSCKNAKKYFALFCAHREHCLALLATSSQF